MLKSLSKPLRRFTISFIRRGNSSLRQDRLKPWLPMPKTQTATQPPQIPEVLMAKIPMHLASLLHPADQPANRQRLILYWELLLACKSVLCWIKTDYSHQLRWCQPTPFRRSSAKLRLQLTSRHADLFSPARDPLRSDLSRGPSTPRRKSELCWTGLMPRGVSLSWSSGRVLPWWS